MRGLYVCVCADDIHVARAAHSEGLGANDAAGCAATRCPPLHRLPHLPRLLSPSSSPQVRRPRPHHLLGHCHGGDAALLCSTRVIVVEPLAEHYSMSGITENVYKWFTLSVCGHDVGGCSRVQVSAGYT